jgi:eukaryotic-like serine/threonine-protein kinase
MALPSHVLNPSETRTSAPPAGAEAPVGRRLGHFKLLSLVGKSQRSMAWRVLDLRVPNNGREGLLLLPRAQPADADTLQRWDQSVRRASRLKHPNLAEALEIGVCEHWPFVLYDAEGADTLAERLQRKDLGSQEAATLFVEALRGLAFAHDGGVAHRDLQPYMLLLGEHGSVHLMGFEVAQALQAVGLEVRDPGIAQQTSVDALQLHAVREAAIDDMLSMGLLLHWALAGQPALDEPDIGELALRMPPRGRELVRLPWSTPMPVPEVLRAIGNRATDRQERHRYRSARGMARALEGWLQAEGTAGGGPLALLLDRLQSVGALPSSPGGAARAARLALMDRERTNELAEVVLQDLALAFELLRWVNSVQVRSTQAAGSGPVLTIRRAIAMLGLDGVRRAALGLRTWPGPLSEGGALALQRLFDDCKRAGRVAQALRPAGYDAEVVHLVTLLQNLGRLIVAYHFPEELQQIHRLMQPAPPLRAGEPEQAGMSEQAACHAVLGTDIEGIGAAVARHWGLDDAVLHLIRRLPLTTQPRTVDSDDDMLRSVASCANEAIDAMTLPAPRRLQTLRRVAQRYTRALRISFNDLQDALTVGDGGKPKARSAEPTETLEADEESRNTAA